MQTTKHKALTRPQGWKPAVNELVWANGKFGTFTGWKEVRSNNWFNVFYAVIQGEDGKLFVCDSRFLNPAI
jgi:hypothetical protein